MIREGLCIRISDNLSPQAAIFFRTPRQVLCRARFPKEDLKNKNFDAIVVATGTKQFLPKVNGIENKNVTTAVEVLKNPELVKDKQNIVIVGGGDSGCELAYMLKYELDKDVTIVEGTKHLMATTCTANRGHIMHYLEEAGVKAYNCTTLKEIKDKSVVLSRNISKTVPFVYNTWQPILPENIHNPLEKKLKTKLEAVEVPADLVVIAFGIKPSNNIYFNLVKENVAPEIYNVGDSLKPGKVFTAVKSAYRKCITI